ncbi:MAG: hypothetical protein AAGF85_18685, partial [Bacteroidota bacterium]
LQFYAELRKEVEGIVAPRGLTAGVEAGEHASNQVFEIYITESIRKQYDQKLVDKVNPGT